VTGQDNGTGGDRGQGGGRLGEKGAGGVHVEGEEGAGREKLICNFSQYFAIEKMQRGGSQQIQGTGI